MDNAAASSSSLNGHPHWGSGVPAAPWQQSNGNGNGQQQQQMQTPGHISVPSAVFVEALRYTSTPVGREDHDVLVKALRETERTGKTYRAALEGLHGVNDHSMTMWKDYYLDHWSTIDPLVARRAPKFESSAPKPHKTQASKPSTQSNGTNEKVKVKKRASIINKPEKSSSSASVRTGSKPGVASGRKTINSITTFPGMEFQPPSRSPTPPSLDDVEPFIRNGKVMGSKYTDKDRAWFLKSLAWQLSCDPDLRKQEICERMAERAPHHTASSWGSHWNHRIDEADRIMTSAVLKIPDSPSRLFGPNHSASVRSSANPDGSSQAASEEEVLTDISEDDADYSDKVDEDEDEEFQSHKADMGPFGSAVTDGDIWIMSHYAAQIDDWDTQAYGPRWNDFAKKYKSRSAKSWVEIYRRRHDDIEALIRMFRSKKGKGRGRPAQFADDYDDERDASGEDDIEEVQPSWMKRKTVGNDPGEHAGKKRREE